MRFEWDDEKNRENGRKHGFDFNDAVEVFSSPMVVAIDDREDYGEDRWVGIGLARSVPVVVLFTVRAEETIRIISVRKALSHERTRYDQAIRDRLGPS
jgi:uncharacterized DUF497 family protein